MNGRFSCDTIATSFGADSLLFLLAYIFYPIIEGFLVWKRIIVHDGVYCYVKRNVTERAMVVHAL